MILLKPFSGNINDGNCKKEVFKDCITREKSGKGCSIFTFCFNDKVMFCGNLDHPNPDGYIKFLPASHEGFGGMLHGYLAKTSTQSWIAFEGGINLRGLMFDTNGLPNAEMNSHPEKPYSWKDTDFWNLLLRKCAIVDDAIDMANNFDFGGNMNFQIHVADSSGNAVVIGPGPDGELAFTRKSPNKKILISTNINNANPEHGYGPYPCKRYAKISSMLTEVENKDSVSNTYLVSVLDSVHFERASYNTIYSYIVDAQKGLFYLYHFHQYNEAVTIDLQKELLKGEYVVKVADLVSEETRNNALREYEEYNRIEKEKDNL
jgi:hypothetical protein